MLGNFSYFIVVRLFFLKLTFLKKKSGNIISVSNSFDQDQDRHSVGPDLGPNCLKRLSADTKGSQLARKELNMDVQLSSCTRGLKFGLGFHQYPYFVYDSSIGSGNTILKRRLVSAFTTCILEEDQNLMSWPTGQVSVLSTTMLRTVHIKKINTELCLSNLLSLKTM